jgi:hypothetical protein
METYRGNHSTQVSAINILKRGLVLNVRAISTHFCRRAWIASEMERDGETFIQLKFAASGTERISAAHSVRDDFLKITWPADAVRFFSRYGPFSDGMKEISMTTIAIHQARVRTVRAMSSKEFFTTSDLQIGLERLEASEVFLQVARSPFMHFESIQDVRKSIAHANFIDHLRGVKVKNCLSCKRQFIQKEKVKAMKYCDEICQRKAAKQKYDKAHPKVKNGKA